MAAPHLTAVPSTDGPDLKTGEVHDLGLHVETGAERIRHLQHEARVLAKEQIEAFAHDLEILAERAAEIAEGGDAYPVGVREVASRIVDDLSQKSHLLTAIMGRTVHD